MLITTRQALHYVRIVERLEWITKTSPLPSFYSIQNISKYHSLIVSQYLYALNLDSHALSTLEATGHPFRRLLVTNLHSLDFGEIAAYESPNNSIPRTSKRDSWRSPRTKKPDRDARTEFAKLSGMRMIEQGPQVWSIWKSSRARSVVKISALYESDQVDCRHMITQ